MKIFSTLLLWVTALQLLNMSMCSDAYWYYFNSDHLIPSSGKLADPTETIVEWLVEMKMGQLDCFTYDRNNVDSKNTVKTSALQIDLQNQSGEIIDLSATKAGTEVFYTYNTPKLQTESSEILSPPPDRI